ncbi:MAG TPA: SAM-dependent methyltransferase [Terriglobales bacterium]|nr:SAM-dependent methyltransferase [Terriglobales bacterium]
MNLRQKIEQEIGERGPLPFSRYMELCLYDSELGYYSRNAEKFGKAGDFYTSSDVHAVFGRLLARQFDEMWRALGSPAEIELLELGPGRGLFAQDVLDWSEKKFPEFYRALRYTLDERSPGLRARLEARFRERIERGKVRLLSGAGAFSMIDVGGNPTGEDPSAGSGQAARRSTEPSREPQRLKPSRQTQDHTAGLKAQPFQNLEREEFQSPGHQEFRGSEQEKRPGAKPEELRCLEGEAHPSAIRKGHGFSRAESASEIQRALASEVPLIIFANEFFDALPVEVLSEKGSLRISTRDGRFVEEWTEPSRKELDFLDRYGVHPTGSDRTEVALLSQQVMSDVAAAVRRGFFVVIDYGYTREEQLAGRHLDTIMTYRQHSASPNPYEAPGEQDITAHVNFTALAAAAEQAGMQMHKLLTQSQFLLGIGEANQFADAFEDCRLPQERAKVALQLKHLVTPSGLGETFHVLVGSKGVDRKLMDGLCGLSFGKGAL